MVAANKKPPCYLCNLINSIAVRFCKPKPKCTRQSGHSEEFLLDAAAGHYVGAETLFQSRRPFVYFTAGFALHLTIELLLKTVCLNKNDEFVATHNLHRLIKDIKVLHLNNNEMFLIKEMDMMHGLRYPNDKSNQGKRTPDLEGGFRYYGEVGSQDLDKGKIIIEKILSLLPKDLSKRYSAKCVAAQFQMP